MSNYRKYPKEGTIGYIVLKALEKNPKVTVEELTPIVLKKFPESKFGKTHLSWYKYQVRKGNYLTPTGDKQAPKVAVTRAPKERTEKKLKGKKARAQARTDAALAGKK